MNRPGRPRNGRPPRLMKADQAQEFIESNKEEAARQSRFLRQDRALVAELMTKVAYRMNLTADSVANIQLAMTSFAA